MAEPTVVDVPHNLGREEARRRMEAGIGKLAKSLPGGGEVSHSWPTPDRMALDISVMGQSIPTTLDVEDDLIRVSLKLPMMLAMMAGAIKGVVRQQGEKMLLADRSKG